MKITGKTIRRVLIAIAGLFLIGILVKAYYDTNSIEIKRFEIENSRLGDALAGAKIAFLSDLHFREMGRLQHQIMDLLNSERPDLIFVGGDLIAFRGSYAPVLTFLSGLTPRLGVYAVLGNTEYSNENGSCILCHKEGSKDLKRHRSPTFLRNSSVNLKINGRELTLLGVDDPVTKRSDLRETLKKMKSTHTAILLAHSPEVFDEASELGIDLVLSGHTHGGQIVLSKFLRRILPLDQTFNFIEGFFQKGKSLMYVSRGIGTSFLPFRFMVRPEIVFFTFTNGRNPSVVSGPSLISNTVSGLIEKLVLYQYLFPFSRLLKVNGVLKVSNLIL